MPANLAVAVFHSGAETTPGVSQAGNGRTVEQHDVKGFLDLELAVEHDEAEADGEDVIGGALLEERAQRL